MFRKNFGVGRLWNTPEDGGSWATDPELPWETGKFVQRA